jgi:hypothetical protein
MTAKRALQALLFITLVGVTSTPFAAAEPPSRPAPRKLAVVGSWLETVSVNGGPTFKSLSTYGADGTWVSHDQGSVITEGPFPHIFSAGHGVWAYQGGRTYTHTSLQLISDLKGDLLFVNTLRQVITLSADASSYRTTWVAEFTDPSGNVVNRFEGTVTARRITVSKRP